MRNKDKSKKTLEPIAIVSLAFRFPGDLSNETSFWQALKDGRDLVNRIKNDRWATDELQHPKRSEPGRSITFSAGVLSRIDEFDAEFFGISPREAAWLDPQQRLLLELAWESLENAGQVPTALAGSNVAVYVGISGMDYGLGGLDDLAGIGPHTMTGNVLSIAANRLSYVFDLRGPSVALDTACSSSLVALHHACNSLRTGESSAALVGGVNLLLHVYPFIGFTKASMLSAAGRCRAFDASGDGYVRAEGGAVLFLKPLNRALADGDDIQALILATGVNSDGGRKTTMTIPSADGQSELMQVVLERSGISPLDVDYIEAHGTGTPVGDPIEAAAISRVYGRCRPPQQPLPIGSVKTNLGHLEAASGMAGLVKTVLSLKHRAIPSSLYLLAPNPKIDFSSLNLEVVTDFRPLATPDGRPLVAGVNSFGFGGANAHVLLQEYQSKPQLAPPHPQTVPPLFLSASTTKALRDVAARYSALLCQHSVSDYYDIAYTAAYARERLGKRLALLVANAEAAAGLLAKFAEGGLVAQAVLEDKLPQPVAVAFVYSGNGTQWVGMGRRLLAESPIFAGAFAALDEPIQALSGFSILEELQADDYHSRLGDTAVAQPLLFAVQVAVTTLLHKHGIGATAVIGHSVGEVAAAWAAGALDLDQAVKVVCARSNAQALTRGTGKMAAVGLAVSALRELLNQEQIRDIEIAGYNSPNNVTVCGNTEELVRLGQTIEARGVFFRLLELEYAFHSRHMDPIKDMLLNTLAGLAPQPCTDVTFVSTVTGNVLAGTALDNSYWWDNVRQPVLFDRAVSTLLGKGCRIFIEIGPHGILQRYLTECLSSVNIAGRVIDTLRRNNDGLERMGEAILRVQLLCDPVRDDVWFPVAGRSVRLPNYPWQRERHWLAKSSEAYALDKRRRIHPLLGWRLKEMDVAWENVLDPATLRWLADHRVGGAAVLPGAAYVEMALAAAQEWFAGEGSALEELDIVAPVVFGDESAYTVRFELSTRDGSFQIRSRQRLSTDNWILNATGRLLGSPAAEHADAVVTDINSAFTTVDPETHYRMAKALGLQYGPSFQRLEVAALDENILHGVFTTRDAVHAEEADYFVHPAYLDVCFQSLLDFFLEDIRAGRGVAFLPVKVGRLNYYRRLPVVRFRTRLLQRSGRSVTADFDLWDASGRLVATLAGCRFRVAPLQVHGETVPACWAIVPQVVPHPFTERQVTLPSNRTLTTLIRSWFDEEEERLMRAAHLKEAQPLFDALSVSFIHNAFQDLFDRYGDWLQGVLHDPGRIRNVPAAFFRWLVDCLQREAVLVVRDGVWKLDDIHIPSPGEIWRTLLRDYPAYLPELVIVARIGSNLSKLLTGEADGQAFLDSVRRNYLCSNIYDDSPTYLGTKHAIARILCHLAQNLPAHRRLRILEICGGVSELPRQLEGYLPAGRVDYVMAEADEESRERLRAEFQDQSFVKIAALTDEDMELTAEDDVPKMYDVIVLRHWLHRVGNPHAVLVAIRRKLAAGGLLLLAERHPDIGGNFVQGLDPRCWQEIEGRAPISSLLPSGAWVDALREHGFEDIETFVEPAGDGLAERTYLLLVKQPAERAVLPEPAAATWLLLADASGPSRDLSNVLLHHLESRGQRAAVAAFAGDVSDVRDAWTFNPSDPASVAEGVTVARQTLGSIDHIVYLVGWTSDQARDSHAEYQEGVACLGLLHVVQSVAQGDKSCPRLWLVTCGGALTATALGRRASDPRQAALWGFGRVIMNEYPSLDCTLIDIATELGSPDLAERLGKELLMPDGESEIILEPEGRYALRLGRVDLHDTAMPREAPRFRLDFQLPGQLRNLVWRPNPERSLREEEIEVHPVAAGLNYRDVMYTLGVLPDEAVENGFSGANLGLEFAGVVTRIGARVHEFTPGDAVIGFGAGCFASHVVTTQNAVAHKPVEWSFESAATVPAVFFTVYYALRHLADLKQGERVLIHGAAGGVGIAAVQLALHLGAEIFATAGSDEKRDFVRLLGSDHVFDSRRLDFADEILALTAGEGVDVILNSLAGEAVRRNLQVLRPFGRFLELGKRDFFENTPIGLRPFKDNISYFGIDADQLLVARPELAKMLFREVMTLFREGVFSPLPHRTFTADRVVDAFRTMQQSQHIGKLVLVLENAQIKVKQSSASAPTVRFDKDATYLVTGGLSGFGAESAYWLAEHGAGTLVLLTRRGMETPGAAATIERLEALGATVRVIACDVADRAALQSALLDIRRELPPLKGVLHAAMVLDDGLIANLDAERFRKVLAPKLLGAKHLHALTLDIPIEHFILYSSITTLIGNPGQANYVVANAYLEGLANLRRHLGLPVTCIGWGPIGDAGYLVRHEAIKEGLQARLGAAPLSARSALGRLGQVLTADTNTIAIADFDWRAMARLLPSAAAMRFERLRKESGGTVGSEENNLDILVLVQGKSAEEAHVIVQDLVAQEVANILGIAVERIDPARPLNEMGMDSLMGVEMAVGLEARFGIQLPTMMLNQGVATVERVSTRIVEKILRGRGVDEDEGSQIEQLIDVMATQHGEVPSSEEIAQTVAAIKNDKLVGARLIP